MDLCRGGKAVSRTIVGPRQGVETTYTSIPLLQFSCGHHLAVLHAQADDGSMGAQKTKIHLH